MTMGPMHEEMSFKIDMSRGQDRESRRLKSHSDLCAWSKISNDGMSGEELVDVRKMVIFGGLCPRRWRRGRRREIDIPQVMVKLVEAVRTIPLDMQVPRFGRSRSTEMMLTNA